MEITGNNQLSFNPCSSVYTNIFYVVIHMLHLIGNPGGINCKMNQIFFNLKYFCNIPLLSDMVANTVYNRDMLINNIILAQQHIEQKFLTKL